MELCALLSSFKSQPTWLLILTSLGLLSFLKLSFSLLSWSYVTFLRPSKNVKKYGYWALITGATDGIGKSFAFQFARKGFNLVLVGRNPQKLQEVSDSIKSKYSSVRVETVVMDFAADLTEGVERIREKIKGLDVGILVNNAGVSYRTRVTFMRWTTSCCVV